VRRAGAPKPPMLQLGGVRKRYRTPRVRGWGNSPAIRVGRRKTRLTRLEPLLSKSLFAILHPLPQAPCACFE
jgi:hypothetical protein